MKKTTIKNKFYISIGVYILSFLFINTISFIYITYLNITNRYLSMFPLILLLSILIAMCFIIIHQKQLISLSYSKELTSPSNNQTILFQVLSENLDIVFMIYDLEQQRMEYVFENAFRILGIAPENLYTNPMELVSCCNEAHYKQIQDLFLVNKIVDKYIQEIDYTNPLTKENKCLNVLINPICFDKRPIKYIITIEDLTSFKNNHQALKDALLNAHSANVAKSDFFSCISHEIRTPLNAIIGLTTIAQSYLHDKMKLEDYLHKITYSSNHLLMLINDVLDMAKIESGKLTLNIETFNLNDVINEIVTITSFQVKEKNQTLTVSNENIPYTLLNGDVLRLKQVLINIVTNAIKYTPEEGKIHIYVKQYGKKDNNIIKVQFSIRDTGYGMSPEYLEKIFDPFVQEDNASKRKNHGVGLGMPIVKNLVSMMNGSIRVKSQLNKGSIFVVTLPLLIANNDTHICNDKKLEELKIMVIDSDTDSLIHSNSILERLNINTEITKKGREGLNKIINASASKNKYDIIFIDMQITDIPASQAIGYIKESSYDTLVIATDIYKNSEMSAIRAGANAFLLKPIYQSLLYNTLISLKNNPSMNMTEKNNSTNSLEGYRILIVEDNELNMEITVEIISQTGATVECAYDGREALMLYNNNPPGYYQLIIMDIQMPNLNGYEATKIIRTSSNKDAKTIPIIAMTSNAFLEDVNEALSVGMNAHIPKPIDIHYLLSILYKVLNI